MMIAPETFAEMHKDDSYEELLRLRDEFLESIHSFEAADGNIEVKMMPSPDVVYQMDLEYLAKVCELISEKFRQRNWDDDVE